jgi:FkbM family methyltransferase
MSNPKRKLAYVLASSDHGTMIINRFDYRMVNEQGGYGVGYQILEDGSYNQSEVEFISNLLPLRQKYFGDGVVAIDCGANIGVNTIEWAKKMTGWGWVIAIEAQERIFYALAGNIAINNCFNAFARFAAVSAKSGSMRVPRPDYLKPASFGSLELKQRANTEFIGQPIDYSDAMTVDVPTLSVDSLNLKRIDLIKIDVEGMEFDVLDGAEKSIREYWPILFVEALKVDAEKLRARLQNMDYLALSVGMNILAVHKTDKTQEHLKQA